MTFERGDQVIVPYRKDGKIGSTQVKFIERQGDVIRVKSRTGNFYNVPARFVIGTHDHKRFEEIWEVVGWRIDRAWRKLSQQEREPS